MTTKKRKSDGISASPCHPFIKPRSNGTKQFNDKSIPVRLQQELDMSGFHIFECISDKGFFSWKPARGTPYEALESISDAKDFTKFLDLNGKPDVLVHPSRIQTPKAFQSPPPDEYENKYPFGKIDATCLYVASRHRNIDFAADIDFYFGGSTLEMLASCDASEPFVATLLPDTRVILVVKNKEYIQNLSAQGFQFERLMTGKPLRGHIDDGTNVISSVEHLHVMNVGTHRVFFRAEVDAIDEQDGYPVEIKTLSPRHWRTKVMFQMISSGSTRLCHGIKGPGYLQNICMKPLHEVSRTALVGSRGVQHLEDTILKGMTSLRSQMKNAKPGEVFRIYFRSGTLSLNRERANILPPPDIVRELVVSKSIE
ncbi:expressed unknown protein [Seminavis robusta]|uniref:Uncharacterized protein n=1 Tax=Seminavis robusta TaxID=568900 RepID=A0A9N8E1L9_9STRA|nr:expressed unknown protein [Seminavis robusta]|eukprot:Sro466_g148750.1 n/a (369) ;mRNA; r:9165-10368